MRLFNDVFKEGGKIDLNAQGYRGDSSLQVQSGRFNNLFLNCLIERVYKCNEEEIT